MRKNLVCYLLFGLMMIPSAGRTQDIELKAHPRLLINSESNGKIKGLEVLRQRLTQDYYKPTWARATNPDYYWSTIADQALVFLLEGDSTMLPVVKQRFAESANRFEYVIYKALAFDWIYDALTPEERETYAKRVFDDALSLYDDYSVYRFVFHNYWQARHAAAGIAMLAVWDDDSRAKLFYDTIVYHIEQTQAVLGEGYPEDDMQGRAGYGGGWPEGYEYDRIASSFYYRLLLCWRSSGLEDYLSDSRYWRDKIYWSIHGVPPDGSYQLGIEDNNYPILEPEDRMRMSFLLDEYKTGHARWYLDTFCDTVMDKHYVKNTPPHWDLIYYDTSVPLVSPDTLPTALLAEGTGLALMRSSWDEDATYMHFHCGPWFTGHQHLAQGSFTIYRGRHLVVEPGVYDGAVDDHYLAWRMRTISHNCITVMDPSEVFTGPSKQPVLENDGGQRTLTWLEPRNCTVEDVREQWDLRNTGQITAFEHHDSHDYVVGEAGNAYTPGKVKRWCRQILFIKPDWVILCDLVTSGNPDHQKTLFLHTPGDIALDGTTAISPAEGTTDMVVYSLLPTGATIETAGGGADTYTYNGKNWVAPVPDRGLMGQVAEAYRLEIKAPLDTTTTYLTAIYVTDPDNPVESIPQVTLTTQTDTLVSLLINGGELEVSFDPRAENSYSISGAEFKTSDINGDGRSSLLDCLQLLLLGWKNPDDPAADWNRDGVYGPGDIIDLLLAICY